MDNDLWSGFWRSVLFIMFVAAVVSSCSCTNNGLTVVEVIEAVKDACDGGVKDIEFDNKEEPKVKRGSCYQEKIIIAK